MLFLLMRWIQYIRKARVQLLSAVRLLSVHALLDGLSPINNAIDTSQTIAMALQHACVHALYITSNSNCSCMPRQKLYILLAANDARIMSRAFSFPNHLCHVSLRCMFECMSTGGRTAAQVAALSSPLPH